MANYAWLNPIRIEEITTKLEKFAVNSSDETVHSEIFRVWAYLTQTNHYTIKITEQYSQTVMTQAKKALHPTAKEEPAP